MPSTSHEIQRGLSYAQLRIVSTSASERSISSSWTLRRSRIDAGLADFGSMTATRSWISVSTRTSCKARERTRSSASLGPGVHNGSRTPRGGSARRQSGASCSLRSSSGLFPGEGNVPVGDKGSIGYHLSIG